MTETTASETPVSAADVDAEAPYGRKADGSPKLGPGGRPAGKRAAFGKKRATRSTSRPAAPSRARKPNTPRAKPVDYSKVGTEVTQMLAGVLGMVPAPAFKLDALALHMRAEQAGQMVNKAAQNIPWLSEALDKWNAVGPYAEPIMFAVGLGAQFAINHGLISVEQTPSELLGTMSPEDLARTAFETAPQPRSEAGPAPVSPRAPEPDPAPAVTEPSDPNGYQPDPGVPYGQPFMTGV